MDFLTKIRNCFFFNLIKAVFTHSPEGSEIYRQLNRKKQKEIKKKKRKEKKKRATITPARSSPADQKSSFLFIYQFSY